MFVADVKCSYHIIWILDLLRRPPSVAATWQTLPNSRTGSAKTSVSEAVMRTWHRIHVIRGRPNNNNNNNNNRQFLTRRNTTLYRSYGCSNWRQRWKNEWM